MAAGSWSRVPPAACQDASPPTARDSRSPPRACQALGPAPALAQPRSALPGRSVGTPGLRNLGKTPALREQAPGCARGLRGGAAESRGWEERAAGERRAHAEHPGQKGRGPPGKAEVEEVGPARVVRRQHPASSHRGPAPAQARQFSAVGHLLRAAVGDPGEWVNAGPPVAVSKPEGPSEAIVPISEKGRQSLQKGKGLPEVRQRQGRKSSSGKSVPRGRSSRSKGPALPGCHDRAVLLYEYVGKRIVDLQHTEVPDAYRGRGIAKHLAKAALDFVVEEDLKAHLTCWYIQKYVKENPLPQYLERLQP
ncbi:PREDICTED: uncharacterized protein LOC101382050 [Odobenus rosmarus divergens]|uniref:Protein NATD1 n=1 Tax=Odobenus rosmarus divergens TaxID=9708 RepID=A0A9B0LTQ7_ODORO